MKRFSLYLGIGLLVGLPVTSMAAGEKIEVDELEVITPVEGDMPMGQGVEEEVLLPEEDDLVEQGIFGAQGGYIHPYLQIEESYNDNIFNVNDGETSSWITNIAPGIWVSLPRKTEVPVSLAANNSSPGGLVHQVADYDSGDKFVLYGLLGSDIYFYSEDSDYNFEDYYVEGMARYNMPGGLSLQILDRFTNSHSIFQTVGAIDEDNIREYDSNLLMLTADWDVTEKLRFKLDYTLFDLSYKGAVNAFLERQDDLIDLYAYYRYSPKTSFFVQYGFADVEYDSASEKDNTQNYYLVGISYHSTDKLALSFKAGWQDKSYDDDTAGYNDSDGLSLDLKALYQITQKTRVSVDLFNNIQESDSQAASEKTVFGVALGYEQQINERITARLDARYENADYQQLPGAESREDDSFSVRPAIQYLFRDWLMVEMGYAYEMTDSSIEEFDYDTNLFSVGLNFAL